MRCAVTLNNRRLPFESHLLMMHSPHPLSHLVSLSNECNRPCMTAFLSFSLRAYNGSESFSKGDKSVALCIMLPNLVLVDSKRYSPLGPEF
jgi:hypothetical protein